MKDRISTRMLVLWMVGAYSMPAIVLAQSAPHPCPANRPVDEMIADIHKQQSKKKTRNANPFPDTICVLGWCRNHSRTPPTLPEPAPQAEVPNETGEVSAASNECDQAMESALKAAHDVDVGDYYYDQKDYRAALLRYQDASQEKANDCAIYVRMGRALEKLKRPSEALEQYRTAAKLQGPQKWSDEAKAGITRLQQAPVRN